MDLLRSSDDIDRNYLLLPDGSLSAAAAERARIFLLLPMPTISSVVGSLLYPVLLHQRSRASRVLWLYVGFLAVLVLYGLYLWWMIPNGTVGLIVPALLAGHLYGLPALLTFLLASSVMDRILFLTPTSRVDASELNSAR